MQTEARLAQRTDVRSWGAACGKKDLSQLEERYATAEASEAATMFSLLS